MTIEACGAPAPAQPVLCWKPRGHDDEHECGGWHWQQAEQPTSKPQFCRSCGASIPHRRGEGRCEKCVEHDPAWARREIERLTAERDERYADFLEVLAERDRLQAVLQWLDRRGGLGLDVHERIREVLAVQNNAGTATADSGSGTEINRLRAALERIVREFGDNWVECSQGSEHPAVIAREALASASATPSGVALAGGADETSRCRLFIDTADMRWYCQKAAGHAGDCEFP